MAGGQICCIIGCPNSFSQNLLAKTVKFHQITKCNAFKWLSVCLPRIRENALYYDRILLCHRHFAKSSYFHKHNNGEFIQGRILKRNAAPTIFPDVSGSEWYEAWAPINKPMNPLIQDFLKHQATIEVEDSSLIKIEKDKGEQIVKPNGEVNIDCLIEEIRRRPDIWSRNKPISVRDEAWRQMIVYLFPRATTEEFSTLGLALWNEWEDLRKIYKRYLSALELHEKDENSPKPTFNYAQQMQFLHAHPAKRLEVSLKDMFVIKTDRTGMTVCLKDNFAIENKEVVKPQSRTRKSTAKVIEEKESTLWEAKINGESKWKAVVNKCTSGTLNDKRLEVYECSLNALKSKKRKKSTAGVRYKKPINPKANDTVIKNIEEGRFSISGNISKSAEHEPRFENSEERRPKAVAKKSTAAPAKKLIKTSKTFKSSDTEPILTLNDKEGDVEGCKPSEDEVINENVTSAGESRIISLQSSSRSLGSSRTKHSEQGDSDIYNENRTKSNNVSSTEAIEKETPKRNNIALIGTSLKPCTFASSKPPTGKDEGNNAVLDDSRPKPIQKSSSVNIKQKSSSNTAELELHAENSLISPSITFIKSEADMYESCSDTLSAESFMDNSMERLIWPESESEEGSPKSASYLVQSSADIDETCSDRPPSEYAQPASLIKVPQEFKFRSNTLDPCNYRTGSQEGDEYDDRRFLISLVPELKCLPESLKLTVRNEIKGILSKYKAVALAVQDHY